MRSSCDSLKVTATDYWVYGEFVESMEFNYLGIFII